MLTKAGIWVVITGISGGEVGIGVADATVVSIDSGELVAAVTSGVVIGC